MPTTNPIREHIRGVDTRRVFGRVIDACAKASGITCSDILGSCRDRWVSRPRQIAMWIMREVSGCTMSHIAGRFDCDCATVRHACRVVGDDVKIGHGSTFATVSVAIAVLQSRTPEARTA